MEDRQKFHFIRTFQQGEGAWLAMIADGDVLAKNSISVDSLRSASRTSMFNAVTLPEGVLMLNMHNLSRLIQNLKDSGIDKGLGDDIPKKGESAGLRRALICLKEREANGLKVDTLRTPPDGHFTQARFSSK